MAALDALSLDEHWHVEYFDSGGSQHELGAGRIPVPSITAWRCAHSGLARIQRVFYLYPTDECVRYFLTVSGTAGHAVLFLNEQRAGQIDGTQSYRFDITDYVALEDNTIAFQVNCAAGDEGTRFGSIMLTAEPCDV